MNSGGSAAHPEIEKEEAKGQFEAGERPKRAKLEKPSSLEKP